MSVTCFFKKGLSLKKYLMISGCVMLLASGCRKHAACYDETLYRQSKDKMCTTDCPGVTGCDGKTYCNECEANREGIRVK